MCGKEVKAGWSWDISDVRWMMQRHHLARSEGRPCWTPVIVTRPPNLRGPGEGQQTSIQMELVPHRWPKTAQVSMANILEWPSVLKREWSVHEWCKGKGMHGVSLQHMNLWLSARIWWIGDSPLSSGFYQGLKLIISETKNPSCWKQLRSLMKAWEATTVGKQGSENSQGETVRTLFIFFSSPFLIPWLFIFVWLEK